MLVVCPFAEHVAADVWERINFKNEHIKTNLCKYSIIDFLSIKIANEVEDGCTFL